MIVETFLLMRKYSQMKKQRDSIIEGYQTKGSQPADVIDNTVNKLSSMMLVVIIVVCVLFALSIIAIVDASRNCGDNKVLHILLLFFIPAYLPLYIILRLTGSICSK